VGPNFPFVFLKSDGNRVARIFLVQHSKMGKIYQKTTIHMYQITTKHTKYVFIKCLHQLSIKLSTPSLSKIPISKLRFFGMKIYHLATLDGNKKFSLRLYRQRHMHAYLHMYERMVSVSAVLINIRVARWHFFKPKIPIWVNLGGSCNWRWSYIICPIGLFYGYLVYFVAIWYIL
jgi:hypothetical protein